MDIKPGHKFGQLTVVSRLPNRRVKNSVYSMWLCSCNCERTTEVRGVDLRRKIRACRSCAHVKHGHTVKRNMTPTYYTWRSMKERCENENHQAFKNYGGRGITICAEWHDFQTFLTDMGERPEGKTLDRIDNNQGYTKINCRWATKSEQARNRRNGKN